MRVHPGRGSETLLPSDNEERPICSCFLAGLSRCELSGTRMGRGLKAAQTRQKLSLGPSFYTHPVFLGGSILHEEELTM